MNPTSGSETSLHSTLLASGKLCPDHTRLEYPWGADDQEKTSDILERLYDRTKKKCRDACATYGALDWATFILPCIGWLRTYKWRKWLLSDCIAGLSVGFMVVPQGMSYANSAGLPSVYGLYGAFLPCLVYSLVGSSKQLAVGPVAVTSLLIGANLQSLIPCSQQITNPNKLTADQVACQDQYNHAAIQLAFIVACLYTGVGILRLGWVTKFLSHAVIGGFTTGAAITIAMGQAKYIFGFSIVMGTSTRLQDYLEQYISKMRNLRWQEFIMGVTLMFVLVAFREAQRFWKPLRFIRPFGPLFLCFAGVATVYIAAVETPDRGNIRVVGAVPAGLPGFTATWWSPVVEPSFTDLLTTAIVVAVVDLLESTSIARALARKNGYELSYNREIIGLGLANIAGAMSNSYTTTGSFSRSAVNDSSGAKTPLAQFVCGWVVGFVLLFLTDFFARIPFNVLAAIVIVSVAGLIEFEQAVYLWKVNRLDLCCWMASFCGCLFYSVEIGLAIAVGLAVMMAVYQTAFPHTAVLGRVPGSTSVYRNIKQYPDAQMTPGILGVRVDAPLYFANVKTLEDKIESSVVKYTAWSQIQGVSKLHFLIVDMTPVHHLDSMGLHFLEDLVFSTRERGIQLILANPSRNVSRDWERIKFPELIGRDSVFVSVHDAFQFAQARLAEMGFSITPVAPYAAPSSSVSVTNGSVSAGHQGATNGGGGKGGTSIQMADSRPSPTGSSAAMLSNTGGPSMQTNSSGAVGGATLRMPTIRSGTARDQ